MIHTECDVVIIGSGAGGGTVARELAPLAAAGHRVVVLEQGPRLREDEYTGRELEMAARLYEDSGGTLTADRSLTIACGRAYGGSTVVYTGTSLVMPPEVVQRWAVPGITAEDVQRRSAKYLAETNAHLLDEELLNDNNRLFRTGCQRLGWSVAQFPINTRGCRGSGMCNLGCPNAAKQGTHRVQLPEAEAAGVEVVTGCRVERISEHACHATVNVGDVGEPSAWEPGEYRVDAKVVVVAAGALESPALLLRSGLGDRLPALGRWLTLHPALILVGEHPAPITNFNGHPKSLYCDEFVSSERFLLETCMYFPFTTSKNLIGFGREHAELMQRFDRLQMILVLALDEAQRSNRVRLGPDGQRIVDYRLSPEVITALHRSMVAAAQVFFAAGAERIHVPAARQFFIDRSQAGDLEPLIPSSGVQPGRISITSAHPMGGCRMGTSSASSVTDEWGGVHGAPWLRVADASLFPRCSEVNPYITVMALADRVAEHIRSHWGELGAA
jgi:choline dehydrogenase-like flavoprotein